MPIRPRSQVTVRWTIRSVPVRTRDGAERLDQVYRRLLNGAPAAAGPQIPFDELQTHSLPFGPSTRMTPPCPSPSMPASQPSARNASCSATIKVRKPVNQDEKVFCRLRRREGEARPEAQATENLT